MFSRINGKHGSIPLSQLRYVRSEGGREVVLFDDGVAQTMAEVEGRGALATVVGITSVTGEWEALIKRDGGLIRQPVLAWGLTAEGLTVPVIPAAPGGIHLLGPSWGVRPLNAAAIYLSDGSVCASEADFIASA